MSCTFQLGSLVRARGREWVVLLGSEEDKLHLRPLGAGEDETTYIYLPLEHCPVESATFPLPDTQQSGTQITNILLRDAMRLTFRSGAGPFRSFGNLAFDPRAYQLVPLLMALKMDIVRLLIADDVGIGKTIEAGLIVREFMDRGEIDGFTVLCPPHLCHQWQEELYKKFNITAEIIAAGTAAKLERQLPLGVSIFKHYTETIVSLDYIKQDRRLDEFLRACPKFVIVDEAHTCVQSNQAIRHQRYKVLFGLAKDHERHMILLTATPHSGDEDAFYNLLGLLKTDFKQLQTLAGDHRTKLREQLGDYFVQRRRSDIAEWQDTSLFPSRLSREAPYQLSGDWGELFHDVLDYARKMVETVKDASILKQRMNWWAALALLRCISSSPAAAIAALRTRVRVLTEGTEAEKMESLEYVGIQTVLDGEDEVGYLSVDDTQPGTLINEGDITDPDASTLATFIKRAEALCGPDKDAKLKILITQLETILREKHNPVVFCRYISTAHYVGQYLRERFGAEHFGVEVVTGELPAEAREEKVKQLGEFKQRILVATDCLSEGINLQARFDAVLHYDLSWNPTRQEQREGRVDRFGQASKTVRTVLLYGENNPVDGTVLQVILRKAERIRKELGVLVPMPDDTKKVMQAIMESILFRSGRGKISSYQEALFKFDDVENTIEEKWENMREKATQNRTIFAQRKLRPEAVLPEWRRVVKLLGQSDDVRRFLSAACERMQAALESSGIYFKLPLHHLPQLLKEKLAGAGMIGPMLKITFDHPSDPYYIHRSHPLVSAFAEYITEQAFEGASPELVSRCGAIFTNAVTKRTLVLLLRLRTRLLTVLPDSTTSTILAEEVITLALQGQTELQILSEVDANALLAAQPSQNIDPSRRNREINKARQNITTIQHLLETVAHARAQQLLEDHKRVRDIAKNSHLHHEITPCLPVDVIGLYVLLPTPSF